MTIVTGPRSSSLLKPKKLLVGIDPVHQLRRHIGAFGVYKHKHCQHVSTTFLGVRGVSGVSQVRPRCDTLIWKQGAKHATGK